MPTISGIVRDDTGAPVAGRIVRAYRRDTGVLVGDVKTSEGTFGDSLYSSTVLVLNFNEEADSTTFRDGSPTPKTVTRSGDVRITPLYRKTGIASAYCDGGGDKLTVASHTDFNFGSGDFEIEVTAFRAGAGSGDRFLIDRGNGASFLLRWSAGGALQFFINATLVCSYTYAFPTLTPVDIKVNRIGTTVRLFVGGAVVATGTSSGSISSTADVLLCGGPSADFFHGYVDRVRVTKAGARHSAAYTPDDQPFPEWSGTLPTGGYKVVATHTGECNVVCLDDSGGTTYNDLILRTTPV